MTAHTPSSILSKLVNGTSSSTAAAAPGGARRVPLDQFDSVFGSLIGASCPAVARGSSSAALCESIEPALTSSPSVLAPLPARPSVNPLRTATLSHPSLLRPLSHAHSHAHLAELSSDALGGSIVDTSDEFFCTADNLLKVPVRRPPLSLLRFLSVADG